MTQHFDWPPVPGNDERPVWDGEAFRIGDARARVLVYDENASNWTEDLTELHERLFGGTHFIDKASRGYALAEIRERVAVPRPAILEVGCSSGYFLKVLHQAMPEALVVGSDCLRRPLERVGALLHGVPLVQFDVVRCPLPSEAFDAVVLLNVLEHIEDDAGALRQVWRILKPGGAAILEVPAGPHLYDIYDKVLLHHRRYSMRHLLSLVRATGFTVAKRSHLGFFLYPAFSWTKRRSRRHGPLPDEAEHQAVAESIRKSGSNALLQAMIRLELFLGRLLRYPVGIRCLVTAVKPPNPRIAGKES